MRFESQTSLSINVDSSLLHADTSNVQSTPTPTHLHYPTSFDRFHSNYIPNDLALNRSSHHLQNIHDIHDQTNLRGNVTTPETGHSVQTVQPHSHTSSALHSQSVHHDQEQLDYRAVPLTSEQSHLSRIRPAHGHIHMPVQVDSSARSQHEDPSSASSHLETSSSSTRNERAVSMNPHVQTASHALPHTAIASSSSLSTRANKPAGRRVPDPYPGSQPRRTMRRIAPAPEPAVVERCKPRSTLHSLRILNTPWLNRHFTKHVQFASSVSNVYVQLRISLTASTASPDIRQTRWRRKKRGPSVSPDHNVTRD